MSVNLQESGASGGSMAMIATVHPYNSRTDNTSVNNASSGFKIEDVTDDPKVFVVLKLYTQYIN